MFLCYEEILCGCDLLDRFQSYVFCRWLVGEKKSSTFQSYRRRCSFKIYESLVKLDFRLVLVMV